MRPFASAPSDPDADECAGTWRPLRTSLRSACEDALDGIGLRVSGIVQIATAAPFKMGVDPHRPPVSLGYRPAYWRVAVEDAAQHPVLGSGAGSFDDVWLERRPVATNVRDAHSLYLETVAEVGIVGAMLLLAALAPPLLAARHARDRQLVAVAAGGFAAFLVHAGLDWDWEMPVTTLAGLACAAALLAAARCDEA